MDKVPVTHQIYAKAFELLEKHPEGMRWTDLLAEIRESDPDFHPKTVNGCSGNSSNVSPTGYTSRRRAFPACRDTGSESNIISRP
jgi:hypothetical protein